MSSSWKDLSGVSIRRERRTQDHTLRPWIESCGNNPGERSRDLNKGCGVGMERREIERAEEMDG